MVHTKEAVLMLDTPFESGESCVLGSTILRSQIVRIQFCSKMPLEVCQGEMWMCLQHMIGAFWHGQRRFSFILNCCMNYI